MSAQERVCIQIADKAWPNMGDLDRRRLLEYTCNDDTIKSLEARLTSIRANNQALPLPAQKALELANIASIQLNLYNVTIQQWRQQLQDQSLLPSTISKCVSGQRSLASALAAVTTANKRAESVLTNKAQADPAQMTNLQVEAIQELRQRSAVVLQKQHLLEGCKELGGATLNLLNAQQGFAMAIRQMIVTGSDLLTRLRSFLPCEAGTRCPDRIPGDQGLLLTQEETGQLDNISRAVNQAVQLLIEEERLLEK
jgi:hypothetical protein